MKEEMVGQNNPASRKILHVDMDAFFVSAELCRNPGLKGRPVLVGAPGKRGVVAAASYEARVFGIYSAMPSVVAKRLCPEAVFLPSDHSYYAEVSRRVMAIFQRFTPLIEAIGLDEAFLDVSGSVGVVGGSEIQADEIRRMVEEEEGLVCSVGVATNKFLAKLASEDAKPQVIGRSVLFGKGVRVVRPSEVEEFLAPLHVSRIWGIGPRTTEQLEGLGISTIGKLAEVSEHVLSGIFGEALGKHMGALARGIDNRTVKAEKVLKSVSQEQTFEIDLTEFLELRRRLSQQAHRVASRLRSERLFARTVTLKIRFSDFTTISRSHSVVVPIDTATEILEITERLLSVLNLKDGVRLLGIAATGLEDSSVRQLEFSNQRRDNDRLIEEAMDSIRERFGVSSVSLGGVTEER